MQKPMTPWKSFSIRSRNALMVDLYGPGTYGLSSLRDAVMMEMSNPAALSGMGEYGNEISDPMWAVRFLVRRTVCRT
jgi:hypothetical protein